MTRFDLSMIIYFVIKNNNQIIVYGMAWLEMFKIIGFVIKNNKLNLQNIFPRVFQSPNN